MFGLVGFSLVWFGLVCFGLVWFGLAWFGSVWFFFYDLSTIKKYLSRSKSILHTSFAEINILI